MHFAERDGKTGALTKFATLSGGLGEHGLGDVSALRDAELAME